MAVRKRLRYEILRRDNHSCRYCGASAPDVRLTVDHVVPQALGGTDDPSNLVAACADCNSGKAASAPDAPVVDDVAEDALRWAAAREQADAMRAKEIAAERAIVDHFQVIWTKYWLAADDGSYVEVADRTYLSRPRNWREQVARFVAEGLDIPFFGSAVLSAMNRKLAHEDVWRYFCGICWREIRARQDIAAGLLRATEGQSGSC
jgi:hypothetical protein